MWDCFLRLVEKIKFYRKSKNSVSFFRFKVNGNSILDKKHKNTF